MFKIHFLVFTFIICLVGSLSPASAETFFEESLYATESTATIDELLRADFDETLHSSSDDVLLGLDLPPADVDDFIEPIEPTDDFAEDESGDTLPDVLETTLGSGGAWDDSMSAAPTQTNENTLRPNVPPFSEVALAVPFVENSFVALTPTDSATLDLPSTITTFSYAAYLAPMAGNMHAAAELSTTGPVGAAAFTFFAAGLLAYFLRKPAKQSFKN